MSIGIYAFLRIVFNALACPFGRALSDTLHALQRRPLFRSTLRGLRCCLYRVSVPGMLGPPGGGIGPEARVGAVSPVTTEKIKKAQKLAAQFCATKNFPPQKQKDPYKGSVFCAILALQALKGRNLQWLKVK